MAGPAQAETAEIVSVCRMRSRTVDRMLSRRDKTIKDLLGEAENRLNKNREVSSFCGRDLFLDVCREYASEHFGAETAAAVVKSLSSGAMLTADHLGGFCSVQSLHGDLLFGRLLENIAGSSCIPVFAFGCVSISSSTFARGLLVYGQADEILRIPVLPRRPTNAAASLIRGYDKGMTEQALKAAGKIHSEKIRKAVEYLVETVYLREDILCCGRFADQAVRLGSAVYGELPASESDTGSRKRYVFLEAEEVFSRLLLRELLTPRSIVSQMLSDAFLSGILNHTVCEDGKPLSAKLFWGCDRNCRVFSLNLCEDGCLRGTDTEGTPVCFQTDPETLAGLLKKRLIMPGLYLCWLLSAVIRDFTWFGGIFQSVYLPEYARLTAKALSECAQADAGGQISKTALDPETAQALSELTSRRDHGGYISGPLIALWDTGDAAVPAGVPELLAYGRPVPDYTGLPLASAHELGCFEFYNDLTDAQERTEGWYGSIARYAKETFEHFILPG